MRSVANAVSAAGGDVSYIQTADDFARAEKLIFPGVGSFGACIERLTALGFFQPLLEYVKSGRPFMGICLGMQTLFEGSDETPGLSGLGVIPTRVTRFTVDSPPLSLAVPHIGWNGINVQKDTAVLAGAEAQKFYFVHSYMALPHESNREWILTTTNYGVEFISAVQRGSILATQFHPEKSGKNGIEILRHFLAMGDVAGIPPSVPVARPNPEAGPTQLAKRIIACLDVRANDQGDLVVTKGDSYDVREKGDGAVRNLGKPVQLAERYYLEGADEVTFLNITSFRSSPLKDQPMLEVLRQTSERVFVPLTIGGGIRDSEDPDGTKHSALEVASEYFRSGADKVSIGTDAVLIAEEYIKSGVKTGLSSIETISHVYGRQAVVISVDPTRVWVADPSTTTHHLVESSKTGPNGEKYCWWQCTIKGGRERRDIGVYEFVRACEALGAGEILLNCIDTDGQNNGYDIELVRLAKSAVSIPVIASSGAGKVEHFSEVIEQANPDAALAAGIFHRNEVPLQAVKDHLVAKGIPVRL